LLGDPQIEQSARIDGATPFPRFTEFSLDIARGPPILNRVVKYKRSLDTTFAALADPTRRGILAALTQGQASVSDLAKPYCMSLPAVMKHLRVLTQAGLVSQEKTGRVRRCRLAGESLRQAADWLARYRVFWETQFDSLDRYLKEQSTTEDTRWSKQPSHRNRSRSK
jgi:DNA-binding transcriptional ArsR family regulator